jgi:hypothetical protein
MNPRLIALAARREILVSAAADQRLAIALDVVPLRAPLALADQGIALVRVVRRHPVWVVGGLAIVALASPRGIGNWLQRSWVAWQLVQRLRGP